MPIVKLITNHFDSAESAKKYFDTLPQTAHAQIHVSISQPAEHPVYGLPKLSAHGNYFYEFEVADCYQGSFDVLGDTLEIVCGVDLVTTMQISEKDNPLAVKEAIYLAVKQLLADSDMQFDEITVSSPVWLGCNGTWFATIKKNK